MEERAVSPEEMEEVIDLYDIVEPSAPAESDRAADEQASPDDEASSSDAPLDGEEHDVETDAASSGEEDCADFMDGLDVEPHGAGEGPVADDAAMESEPVETDVPSDEEAGVVQMASLLEAALESELADAVTGDTEAGEDAAAESGLPETATMDAEADMVLPAETDAEQSAEETAEAIPAEDTSELEAAGQGDAQPEDPEIGSEVVTSSQAVGASETSGEDIFADADDGEKAESAVVSSADTSFGDAPVEPAISEDVSLEDAEGVDAAVVESASVAVPVDAAGFARLDDVETCLNLAVELGDRIAQLEKVHQGEMRMMAEKLEASEKSRSELAEVMQAQNARLDEAGEVRRTLEGAVEALRQELAVAEEERAALATSVQELQATLSAAEEARHALAETVEAQRLQLEQAEEERRASAVALSESMVGLQQTLQTGAQPTAFLEDASLRLALEELVCRMMDARFETFAQEQSVAQAERQAVEAAVMQAATVSSERLSAVEQRMTDWEAQSGQMAAAAAARVIRDEIAAMKAEASRSRR